MESSLGSNLARLVRVWRSLIDYRLKPLQLTQTHWITLHSICQLPTEKSQIQLAKIIGIEQPSLVRTLDQLEEKGLIIRKICIKDRRAKKIKLTKIAHPIIYQINQIIMNTTKEIFQGISQKELQDLYSTINKLEKNIMNIHVKY